MAIYRTVYTVEVFTNYDLASDIDAGDLTTINYIITEGDGIGLVETTSVEIVPPEAVEAHLVRIGNDGSFFDEC